MFPAPSLNILTLNKVASGDEPMLSPTIRLAIAVPWPFVSAKPVAIDVLYRFVIVELPNSLCDALIPVSNR